MNTKPKYHHGLTTAVEDIERSTPTKTPSEDLPPHNCKWYPIKERKYSVTTTMII